MVLRFGLIAAKSKPEAHELALEIIPWLEQQGCAIVTESALMAGAESDVLVTIGGDGLIMRMAHALQGSDPTEPRNYLNRGVR